MVIGYLKGKSAIDTSRDSWGKKEFYEQEFLDERVLCKYGWLE
jgi:hypothetical protein